MKMKMKMKIIMKRLQMKQLLKKRKDVKRFWPYHSFGDKELKFNYFKLKLAYMSNEIDKKLFE